MLRILGYTVYYQLIIFLRIKQAVFFSFAFPIFLFLIFCSIWGSTAENYVSFLLTGILGMTIASEGLLAIGPVIKQYYASGLIRYLKKLPFNILLHFVGLIISRMISLFYVTIFLCLIAIFFDFHINLHTLYNYIIGIIVGLFVFSFLGLFISFSGIKHSNEKGFLNFIYFIILFTSNAFYSLDSFNSYIGIIGNVLPLNPVLSILRGENINYILIIWLIVTVSLFYFSFKKINFER